MPRSPSPDLARWLIDHQLCTPSDFARCGKRVAKLVEDLPPFDFVWLDALVQLGRLSPYQAQILESPEPDQLLLGPCVLVHPCSSGRGNRTWKARHTETGARVAVKRISAGLGEGAQSTAPWHRLTHSLRGLRYPGICGPIEALPTARGTDLLSPWVDGPHLRELVVRIGRFPPAVVIAIGWQLLHSLQTLESLGLHHGDLRLENLRLTPGGQVVLVDTGVRPILEPEQTVHSGMDPNHFEGVAPERIGTAQSVTPASELYALGCLLWHLLVGRPPFPAGDPVVKLSRHQNEVIKDVRENAPDTPAALAEVLLSLTRHDPSHRPPGPSGALAQWPRSQADPQQVLKAFLKVVEQPTTLPRGRQTHRRLSMAIWGVLGLVVFAGAGFLTTRAGFPAGLRGQRAEPTANTSTELAGAVAADSGRSEGPEASWTLQQRSESIIASDPGTSVAGDAVRMASHVEGTGKPAARSRIEGPLPPPDAEGVVSLSGEQVYEMRDLSAVGELRVLGEGDSPARIRIREPVEITAESIVIQNVIFEVAGGLPADPGETMAALTLRTQRAELVSVGCLGGDQASTLQARPALLRWELVDERDIRNSNLRLSHCAFRDGGAAVVIPQVVARVEVRDSLFEGGEVALELAGNAKRSMPLSLRWSHVTTRRLENIVRWWGEIGPPGKVRLEWELQDSVLHLNDPQAALLQLLSQRYTNDWISRVRIGGAGTLLAPEQTIVRWQSESTGESVVIDSPDLEIEGLMGVPFVFASDSGATLQSLEGMPGVALRRRRPPGCDPTRLPGLFRTPATGESL